MNLFQTTAAGRSMAGRFLLTCCIALVLSIAPSVSAQETIATPIPPIPAERDAGGIVVPPPIPADSGAVVPEIPAESLPPADSISVAAPLSPVVSPGYWIVSTHQLSQSFDGCCPAFCPQVYRHDCGAGCRGSSLAELSQSLIPGVPVCIVVHGSFVDWDSVHSESLCTYRWLQHAQPGMPLQMIYLTWPSNESLTPFVQIDVAVLGRRAARNGCYL
ncbi:MAG: hypothetical protein KDA85_07240, partial [Planctomycetaceae bacterium]|nr:hypothetical protein [Planctomycetaceae bacterium]